MIMSPQKNLKSRKFDAELHYLKTQKRIRLKRIRTEQKGAAESSKSEDRRRAESCFYPARSERVWVNGVVRCRPKRLDCSTQRPSTSLKDSKNASSRDFLGLKCSEFIALFLYLMPCVAGKGRECGNCNAIECGPLAAVWQLPPSSFKNNNLYDRKMGRKFRLQCAWQK